MKLLKLICNNCNAQLGVDIDNLQAYCPYCGQKLLFDLNQMERVLAEKEQTKRAREKTKRAEEATKRVQIKLEYKDKKDRRDNAVFRNTLIGLVLFLILDIGFLFYYGESTERKHLDNNEIKVSVSAKDLKGENVQSVIKILENIGFQNVETNNKEDLLFGVFSKEGEVESITINGDSKFSKGDWFPEDSIVIVTYHGFPED